MAGDFDVSDADYERDAGTVYYPYTLLPRVANPLHPAPEVEDSPRDAQPARLSGEVL